MCRNHISSPIASLGQRPTSDIGRFQKLPGELRNRIYRNLFQQDQVAVINLKLGTCGVGPCLHTKATHNLPAIASTCRQLRWEATSIFFAETPRFEFDEGAVQQACVGNYLRSVGDNADLIAEYSFLMNRPLWNVDKFRSFRTYRFILRAPRSTQSGEFELIQEEITPFEGQNGGSKVCQCDLQKLVDGMNQAHAQEKRIGELVAGVVDSEEFADFVWRLKKTKQHVRHLGRCGACGEVVFCN
jgi:hypothetical protein